MCIVLLKRFFLYLVITRGEVMEKEGVKMRFSLAKERKDADLIQTKLSAAYTAVFMLLCLMTAWCTQLLRKY